MKIWYKEKEENKRKMERKNTMIPKLERNKEEKLKAKEMKDRQKKTGKKKRRNRFVWIIEWVKNGWKKKDEEENEAMNNDSMNKFWPGDRHPIFAFFRLTDWVNDTIKLDQLKTCGVASRFTLPNFH